MNPRIAFLVGLVTLSVFSFNDLSFGEVDTRPIEAVRGKTVLETSDLQIIDEFVSSAVKDIVRTRDFSQVSKTRSILIGKKGTQPQYAQQFSDSCRKQISAGLEQASVNLPEDRKFKVLLNLLILADGLQDPALAELGLVYLGHPNTSIQYWAVRLVTNTAVVEKIQQGNWPIGGQIIGRLRQSIQGGASEVLLGLIAEFAAKLGIPEGQTLLTEVADLRIAQHAKGQVEDGQVDTTILKLLAAQITSTHDSKAGLWASRFSQLYSYIIQRLAKADPPLGDVQRQRWISVIVEVEEKCIAPVLENYQMPLRKAIEKSDMTALLAEHDTLLGSSTLPGQWVTKWQFDYGTGPDGRPRTWPKELPAPRVTQ